MEFLDYIKSRYEQCDKALINAFVYNTPDAFITYIYDLLVVEFDAPFGQSTKDLAKELYEEQVQAWVVQMKLFDPLLR